MRMARHLPAGQPLAVSPLSAACAHYRLRLGWPVRVDEQGREVALLTGEVITRGGQAGSRCWW